MAKRAAPPSSEASIPEKTGREFDFDAIRFVSRASRLLDVNISRFAGQASRPLVGTEAHRLRQRMAFRATRHPAPEDLVLSAADFEFTAHDQDGELLLTISGAAVVVYALSRSDDDEITESGIDQFAEANGLYHAWPYLRELVGSLSTRLGLGGVLLPIWTPPKTFPPAGEYLDIVFEPPPQEG